MPGDTTVRLIEDMRFNAIMPRGHELVLDSGKDTGGGNAGPSPLMLVLTGLAGCGAMDVISILRKMRQEVTSYEVHVSGERATEHPKVYTSLTMTHRVAGTLVEEDNVRRAIELSATRYCPVFAMLAPTVPIRVLYEITPADGIRILGEVDPEPQVGA